MKLVFISNDKISGKRVTILEYTGFDKNQIESILEKTDCIWQKRGGIIVIDGISKNKVKEILIKSGIEPENIIVEGEFLSFKYLLKGITIRRKASLVCPRCGSKKIRKISFLSGWLTPLQFICENCGYSGVAFLEESENDKHKT